MAYNNNGNIQQRNNDDDFSFELKKHIGIIGTKDNGWTKEVNIIAWNGGRDKVDVRDWDPNHVRMSRGITLFDEEAEKLVKALAGRYNIGGEAPAASVPASAAAFAAPAAAESAAPAQM